MGDLFMLAVADAAVEEAQQDRAIFHCPDIFVLGVHRHRPKHHVEVGIHIQNLLANVEHGDFAAAARRRPVHREFGFCVSSHAATSWAASTASGTAACPLDLPQCSGPNLRTSSTINVIS